MSNTQLWHLLLPAVSISPLWLISITELGAEKSQCHRVQHLPLGATCWELPRPHRSLELRSPSPAHRGPPKYLRVSGAALGSEICSGTERNTGWPLAR